MIVVMKPEASKAEIEAVIRRAEQMGCRPHPIFGEARTVIALVGDLTQVAREVFDEMNGVSNTMRIQEQHKLTNRTTRPENTVIHLAGSNVRIGGNEVVVMAGPCSVEGRNQIIESAIAIKEAGARVLRGGAFKPRTSPYDFQGLREEGLALLAEARRATGMPVITEVKDTETLKVVAEHADILQIGARNMQNFSLLEAVGALGKPVMLKRGIASTVNEWLMAAEYIVSRGNYQVMLCERGIRTYETLTRNTLDLGVLPLLRAITHLPIVVDPSHGTGVAKAVAPMARAAAATGVDGVIVEVHPNPSKALSDGPQALTFDMFTEMMSDVRKVAAALGQPLG